MFDLSLEILFEFIETFGVSCLFGCPGSVHSWFSGLPWGWGGRARAIVVVRAPPNDSLQMVLRVRDLGGSVRISGGAAAFSPLTSLRAQDIGGSAEISGGAAAFSPLMSLRARDLGGSAKISGGAAASSTLTSLRARDLGGSAKISGGAAAFSTLTSLWARGLGGSATISGGADAFSPLTSLREPDPDGREGAAAARPPSLR